MSILNLDDLVVGNGYDVNSFRHYDALGVLVETIDISGLRTLHNPGYTPANIWVIGLSQYGTSVYALLTDFFIYNVVVEFSSSLSYVRYVCKALDASDPAQNPGGVPAALFEAPSDIELDANGNIYIGTGATNPGRNNVFQYDNAGAFVSIISTTFIPDSPVWAVKSSTSDLYLINNNAPGGGDGKSTIIQRWNAGDLGDQTVYASANNQVEQARKGSFDSAENFYVGSHDLVGGAAINPMLHVVDPTFAVTTVGLTLPTGVTDVPDLVRPTTDSLRAWIKVYNKNVGPGPEPTYMYQALVADGSLVIDKIQIAPAQDGTAEILVYHIGTGDICDDIPFDASCGDIFVAYSKLVCTVVEARRGAVLLGRISLPVVGLRDQPSTMCFDREGRLYVPYYTGASYAPNVLRFGNTSHHYTSAYTVWFTPPVALEFPLSVSRDQANNIYVLVGGGGTNYGDATYLKLYKLNTAATILATYSLGLSYDATPVDVLTSGSYVDPTGSRFLYGWGNFTATRAGISAFDLINNSQLPDLVDTTTAAFIPAGGLRFHLDRVLVLFYPSTTRVRSFSRDGTSFVDVSTGIAGVTAGDIENDIDRAYVFVSDQGAVYDGTPAVVKVNLTDGTNSLAFHVDSAVFSNNLLLATLCAEPKSKVAQVTLVGAT